MDCPRTVSGSSWWRIRRRRRGTTRAAVLVGIAVLLATVVTGCTQAGSKDPASPSPTTSQAAGTAVFTLLDNGRLVVTTPGHHGVQAKLKLSQHSSHRGFPLLAESPNHHRLYVLAAAGRHDQVAAVDPADHRIKHRWSLPRTVTYRALVVGPRTGRLYLFGNRKHGKASDAVVTMLDPRTGHVIGTRRVRKAKGNDWFVYAAATSHNEKRLFLSYHGDTDGIDVVRRHGDRIDRCRQTQKDSSIGCITGHGNFLAHHGRVYATLGDPADIMKLTLHGHRVSHIHTGLSGNHLMEFATDLPHHRIYPIGSCDYAGGLAVINLHSGKHNVLAKTKSAAPRDLVCGDRAVTVPGQRLLAVAHVIQDDSQDTGNNAVQLVSTRSGHIKQNTEVHSKPADLLGMRIPSGGR